MTITTHLRSLAAIAVMLLAAGCGGGGMEGAETPSGNTGGSGGGTGGDDETSIVRIGYIDSTGNFIAGSLFLRANPLAPGGTTDVVANLVDGNGAPIDGTPYTISFNSGCIAQDLSTITTPVKPTTAGLAVAEYTSKTCEGSDTIVAAVVGVAGATASATLTVQPATLGTIAFDSASSTVIAPKGTGGTTTATVRFKVLSEEGKPVPGRVVDFSLDNTAGGLTITPQGTSNSEGLVEAIVNAGTVVTPVQVVASMTTPQMVTTYSGLRVGAGAPDQDSFSLSLSTFNVEGQSYDGETVNVTVRLADVHNNRVPDGTVVAFMTSGGAIDSVATPCVIREGACTVTWVSQNPRTPIARILAYATGDESFIDANGNGLFDTGETFAPWDLGEPYIDLDGSGTWQSGEPFVDANSSGDRTPGNGIYDGLLCADRNNRADCGSNSTLVWATARLAMSSSNATIVDSTLCPATLNVAGGVKQTCTITVGDAFGNAMPEGTTVAAKVTNGKVEQQGPTRFDKRLGPQSFRFIIEGDGTPSTGELSIEVSTPKQNVTNFFGLSDIND